MKLSTDCLSAGALVEWVYSLCILLSVGSLHVLCPGIALWWLLCPLTREDLWGKKSTPVTLAPLLFPGARVPVEKILSLFFFSCPNSVFSWVRTWQEPPSWQLAAQLLNSSHQSLVRSFLNFKLTLNVFVRKVASVIPLTHTQPFVLSCRSVHHQRRRWRGHNCGLCCLQHSLHYWSVWHIRFAGTRQNTHTHTQSYAWLSCIVVAAKFFIKQ